MYPLPHIATQPPQFPKAKIKSHCRKNVMFAIRSHVYVFFPSCSCCCLYYTIDFSHIIHYVKDSLLFFFSSPFILLYFHMIKYSVYLIFFPHMHTVHIHHETCADRGAKKTLHQSIYYNISHTRVTHMLCSWPILFFTL